MEFVVCVSFQLAYEAPAHAPNGEDGDGDGVHEGRRLVRHVHSVRTLAVRFSNKFLYNLQMNRINIATGETSQAITSMTIITFINRQLLSMYNFHQWTAFIKIQPS